MQLGKTELEIYSLGTKRLKQVSEQKITKKTLMAGVFLLRADHGFIYTKGGRVHILSIKICSDTKN